MPLSYTLAIDAMGGDYGPAVIVPAALSALQQDSNLHIILVGELKKLREQLSLSKIKVPDRLLLQAASQVVTMDESPALALRNKKDSSMRVALNLVKEKVANACVSAGNTGALMATARFVLKTLPGIDRPAISAMLPTMKQCTKVRLLDLGANVDSQAQHLFQFAIMGAVLSTEVDNIIKPRLALLNIGSEEIKGNEQVKKAAELLKNISLQSRPINYVGYIEGDKIYQGIVDVIICDGFVGNVALKVMEGVARLMSYYINRAFRRNFFSKISGLIALPVLKNLRKRLDPAYYNGASLVGLRGIVIKSHGSANVLAFRNAIHEAVLEVQKNIPERIRERLTDFLKNSE